MNQKKEKARELRYRKPIVKNLNLEFIEQDLWDIQGECECVRWYTDSDDGEDSLLNALIGDEDEAYEFRMMFADLCAECDRMEYDLKEEWVPECFDIFFVSVGDADDFGGLLGFDSYEKDYFGISPYESFAEDEAKKKLMRMTKEDLITSARQCFKVYQAYIGLRHRYDCLKSAMDILKDKNTGYIKTIKEIEKLYEKASKQEGYYANYSKEWKEFERYTDALPQEAWIV